MNSALSSSFFEILIDFKSNIIFKILSPIADFERPNTASKNGKHFFLLTYLKIYFELRTFQDLPSNLSKPFEIAVPYSASKNKKVPHKCCCTL